MQGIKYGSKKIGIIFTCLSVMCIAKEESFVVHKKDKKRTTADAKVMCGEMLTDCLVLSPASLEKIARIQNIGMKGVARMLDGAYFTTLSHQEIQEHAQEYERCKVRQQQINDLMQEQVECLEKLSVQGRKK